MNKKEDKVDLTLLLATYGMFHLLTIIDPKNPDNSKHEAFFFNEIIDYFKDGNIADVMDYLKNLH